MTVLNKISISHITSLVPQAAAEYFCLPQKVESWFASQGASCTAQPVKNAIEIMILQDHYLEWIFPNSLASAIVNKTGLPLEFAFYQINFEFNAPILSKIEVVISPHSEGSIIQVSISGPFDDEMKKEILHDWSSLIRLCPVSKLTSR